MTKVSVIIPAYNAAKTVERTVRSVLASTIPLDVLVVDDGSTDGTGYLLEKIENEFELSNGSRLVVMHQQNCGAYQARLNALKRIKTPYFGFVDADDTIEPEMYEKMLAVMERENLDAVQCGYKIGSHVEHVEHVEGRGMMVLAGEELTRYKFGYLVNPQESCFIWDKLYRNQYDFDSFELTDKVTNFDDMIFNLQFFRKIERFGLLDEALYNYQKKTVRKMILKDHKRPDGRELTQIRPLAAEVDIIPRVHGSAMFTRGQTQICDVCTLAPLSESQRLDGLDENETGKRYMHHYNFPSYSVGETKVSRGPGRREIGHGALAERALLPVLPNEEEFPYAIRCVSETFESNGSTSMASTCASCMSLMAAGVPIKAMVGGISCGLVTGDTDDDYVLLTDIQGLEDFFGDMDFKVTGTHKGITAIQMDIKIHGLTPDIIRGAIARCREARVYIMDEVMSKAIAEPRKELSKYAPKIITIMIDPQKIGDVVGKQGKVINRIIDECGVKIDISEDGTVAICGTDPEMMEKAKKTVEIIVTEFYEGQKLTGKVVSIREFGAFLEFAPGKEGMVHISKVAKERINRVEDVLTLGDVVDVVCLGKDKMGRYSFSIKDANKPYVPQAEREERSDRNDRNDRRNNRQNRDNNRSYKDYGRDPEYTED